MSDRITVVLADDNLIAREGVRALLALEDDIEVVGVAADYDELSRAQNDSRPRRSSPTSACTGLPAGGHRRGEGDPQASPPERAS